MITIRSEGYIFQGAISLHINKVQNYNCLYWKQDGRCFNHGIKRNLYNHNKILKFLVVHNELMLLYRIYICFILYLRRDNSKHNCIFQIVIGIFRWGTHLYMSPFLSVRPSICPSVHPSVVHHISGSIHHLIIIFGAHM